MDPDLSGDGSFGASHPDDLAERPSVAVLHGDDLSLTDAVDAHQPCSHGAGVHGTDKLHKRLAILVQTPYLHVEAYFNPRFERPIHIS
jgi:hypothetical protein